jgi:hypothetical protein
MVVRSIQRPAISSDAWNSTWNYFIASIHFRKYHRQQQDATPPPPFQNMLPATVRQQGGYQVLTGFAPIMEEEEVVDETRIEELQRQTEYG